MENNKKKVVALVPIKLNNERTPGKNLKQFSDGVTLLEHSLNNLSKSTLIDDIYVFCSDELVKEYCPVHEKVHFLQRSKALDSSETKSQDILRAFIDEKPADIYVLFHVTSPFITPQTIDCCVDNVLNGSYDSAHCVKKIEDFLWVNNQPLNFDPTSIVRTQDLPEVVKEITGIYVFERNVFETLSRRVGNNVYRHYINSIEEIDIDYPADFELAYAMYNYYKNKE